MPENEAQRLCCRMLQTVEQAMWLIMKLKGYPVDCCRLESRDSARRFSFWVGRKDRVQIENCLHLSPFRVTKPETTQI